jgi:hypothetical protein
MMRWRASLTVALSSEDLISRVRQSGQVEFCMGVNKQQAMMHNSTFTLLCIQVKRLDWCGQCRCSVGNYKSTQLLSAERVSACVGEASDTTVLYGLSG